MISIDEAVTTILDNCPDVERVSVQFKDGAKFGKFQGGVTYYDEPPSEEEKAYDRERVEELLKKFGLNNKGDEE